MKEVTHETFGLVIAYLLPGFFALWGVSFVSETVRAWLSVSPATAPTVGGFLFGTLGSLAAGMMASTVRWAVIDAIHHRTGIPQPEWDFRRLQRHFEAFEGLVTNHYRYYQALANSIVASVFSFVVFVIASDSWPEGAGVAVVILAAVEVLLWTGSRDALRKYYERTSLLLSESD